MTRAMPRGARREQCEARCTSLLLGVAPRPYPRQVAATQMNATSSRTRSSYTLAEGGRGGTQKDLRATINLDLAGSSASRRRVRRETSSRRAPTSTSRSPRSATSSTPSLSRRRRARGRHARPRCHTTTPPLPPRCSPCHPHAHPLLTLVHAQVFVPYRNSKLRAYSRVARRQQRHRVARSHLSGGIQL